ncbi:hypothetical protein [Laceyella putida]|uniref:hypothetical protein n=1 Tax=Laceyella putida TaxID=110101 RepID=UPI00362ED98D
MFFVCLTLILLVAVAAGILFTQGMVMEGGVCLAVSIALFILWLFFYSRLRKKKREDDGLRGCLDCLDCLDCSADCSTMHPFRRMDCDCVDCT